MSAPVPPKRTHGQHGAAKPRPPGTLKAAVLALVDDLGGHIPAGEIAGNKKGHVQRWTDPDNGGDFPGVHKVRALEAAAVAKGHAPSVTRFLAAEAGFALIKIEPSLPKALQLMGALLAGEFGDLLRALSDATADDGRISPEEAGPIIKEGHELLGAVAAVMAVAMRARDGGGA